MARTASRRALVAAILALVSGFMKPAVAADKAHAAAEAFATRMSGSGIELRLPH